MTDRQIQSRFDGSQGEGGAADICVVLRQESVPTTSLLAKYKTIR